MSNLSNITASSAADRIDEFARHDRLVTGQWHDTDGTGREIACLLGAIHGDIKSVGDCPAHLMPGWMAETTVRLFDASGEENAREIGHRYAAAMRFWPQLSAEQWAEIKTRYLIDIVMRAVAAVDAMPVQEATWPRCKAACEEVVVRRCGVATRTI